ncbi:hypothetical protein O181_025620 [Austropuccinia psidii MF-1]|uniref:Raptor N-terminal CASPase-like domain-containing protein n=1 Tax=Austropuccinia psidii MF-1 TaxID=1389203 RepID=A0A9Q3H1C3_9BASI|nr:hypothetical protein [Austropuccinia psidii MF-1]
MNSLSIFQNETDQFQNLQSFHHHQNLNKRLKRRTRHRKNRDRQLRSNLKNRHHFFSTKSHTSSSDLSSEPSSQITSSSVSSLNSNHYFNRSNSNFNANQITLNDSNSDSHSFQLNQINRNLQQYHHQQNIQSNHSHSHSLNSFSTESFNLFQSNQSLIYQASQSNNPTSVLRVVQSHSQSFLRHGFDDRQPDGDYLESLSKPHSTYWTDSPYKNTKPSDLIQIPFWSQPIKYRTVCAALFLCLRLGFDPPDIVKASPAPRLEAWTDPKLLPKESVLELIAKRLQEQFEALAPTHARVKFKTYADVYAEEFKKTLIGLRKFSKTDRCLIYYNGHGVPKPTPTGEIWVFNKAYTQYIPISLSDILDWVGTPVVFIWDCNNAGHILNSVILACQKKDQEISNQLHPHSNNLDPNLINSNKIINNLKPSIDSNHLNNNNIPSNSIHPSPSTSGRNSPTNLKPLSNSPSNPFMKYSDTIQLAACQPNEMLPLDPNLPADVFTSCLTSPIEMALRFYVLRNNSQHSKWTSTSEFFNDLSKLDKVPGRMEMRRTPLGELTWIFTSIADAIAWNHLDRKSFTKIFRGDLVLAGTFRGFLLSERVMKSYGCTPMSNPKLPSTSHSELWQSWDLEVDMCLSQLLEIWKSESIRAQYDNNKNSHHPNSLPPPIVTYKPSTFFSQQLTAFEVWLKTVVAQNSDENGEKDHDHCKKRETLQWSCNDWSAIKIDQVNVTDFSCSNPNQTSHPQIKPTLTSNSKPAPNFPINKQNISSIPPTLITSKTRILKSTSYTTTSSPIQNKNLDQRPIRYKLPTFIKHFPLGSRPADDLYPPSPPQLPIVLQVLLSPLHRLRALILLCRLMDLGPWAVHLSLSIGIFQYVLKLLQAPAAELKPVLIFIWARILTVYPDGRQDLFRFSHIRPGSHADAPIEYFIKIMAPNSMELPVVNVVDHKAMCAFILSIGCKNSRSNSKRLMEFGVLEIIIHRIKELAPWQRQWYLILLAHMWEESAAVKGRAIKMGINTILSDLLTDKVPEVRTAALYAFGTLIGVSTNPRQIEIEDEFPDGYNTSGLQPSGTTNPSQSSRSIDTILYQSNKLNSLSSSNPLVTGLEYHQQISIEVGSAMACCHCSTDGSPMFRQELVVVLSALVDQHLGHFIVAAFEFAKQQERERFMKMSDSIRKYRNEKQPWMTSSCTEFDDGNQEVDDDELDKAENLMTDRTTKLEKLIAKLKADEKLQSNESLRAYLWMEFSSVYIVLLDLILDPSEQVSQMAKAVIDYIHLRLTESVLGSCLGLDELIDEEIDKLNRLSLNQSSQNRDEPTAKSTDTHNYSSLSRVWSSSAVSSSQFGSLDRGRNSNSANRPSSSSVFQSLSTVNNLVPNFVKSSGWRTPFTALSRSPEQTSPTFVNDQSTINSGVQESNKSKLLRKSVSMSPLNHHQQTDDELTQQRKKRVVPQLKEFSSDSLESTTVTQQSSNQESHIQRLTAGRSLQSIIAETRAADHIRRQINHSYLLQQSSSPSSTSTFSSNQSIDPNSRKPLETFEGSCSKSSSIPEESFNDYLYYLGIQNIEHLKLEQDKDWLINEQNKGKPQRESTRTLPLCSNYYELSSHTFLKPKMTNVGEEVGGKECGSNRSDGGNDEETDGIQGIKNLWRKQRNAKAIIESPTLRFKPVPNNWNKLVCTWNQPRPVTNLLLHQFESHFITSDSGGFITVYDWQSKTRLNSFRNSAEQPRRIMSMELINEESEALLLASTADGHIRIFRDYDRAERMEVVTAFKGLPNHEPSTLADAGVVTDWQQSTGLLLVGGNSREIKVWNSCRESCVENIKTRANSCMTSLSSDHVVGSIICAGFGDGSMRIYDRRQPLKNSMVRVYRGLHTSWLTRVQMQAGGRRELISGDSVGFVGQWDVRMDRPLRMFRAHEEGMPAIAVHENSPIMASASINGTVKLWDVNNFDDVERTPEILQRLNCNSNHNDTTKSDYLNPSESLWNGGGGKPITALTFHPYQLMIGISDGFGALKLYEAEKR